MKLKQQKNPPKAKMVRKRTVSKINFRRAAKRKFGVRVRVRGEREDDVLNFIRFKRDRQRKQERTISRVRLTHFSFDTPIIFLLLLLVSWVVVIERESSQSVSPVIRHIVSAPQFVFHIGEYLILFTAFSIS